MTRTEHSFVAPSGLSLAVHDWGGTGDPVLLSHPTGFHGVAWQPVAERLIARGRRVWSFDFRGHGDSDKTPDGTYYACSGRAQKVVVSDFRVSTAEIGAECRTGRNASIVRRRSRIRSNMPDRTVPMSLSGNTAVSEYYRVFGHGRME